MHPEPGFTRSDGGWHWLGLNCLSNPPFHQTTHHCTRLHEAVSLPLAHLESYNHTNQPQLFAAAGMKVLKFGGSSVGDAGRIGRVMDIVRGLKRDGEHIAVVVSAIKGTTDQLIQLAHILAQGQSSDIDPLRRLEKRHIEIIRQLISLKSQSEVLADVKLMFNELEDVLQGVNLVKELTPRTLDFITSFGERLSAFIISCCLSDSGTPADFLDARILVKTNSEFGSARPIWEVTYANIQRHFAEHQNIQIVTGFVASTLKNETTTLGRGGSDFTASIFGSALNAEEIQIWTDVDGVLTANPGKVKSAFSLDKLSYEEAMELSHFGAKVIHPPTIQPALDKNIPLLIKNTFNPEHPGTLVSNDPGTSKSPVKGISSIDSIALLRVQGSGMIGIAGTANRIFKALASHEINVILITQGSSEHSICFAVRPDDAIPARKAIESEFGFEFQNRLIEDVIIEEGKSVIALVGENMHHVPGVAANVFKALGTNGINVSAIAQGSSELNISVVIDQHNEAKALNALHDAFFLSGKKTIHLFVAGVGLVGKTVLETLKNQQSVFSEDYDLILKVVGLANSRSKLIDPEGISLVNWRETLTDSGRGDSIETFVEQVKSLNLPNSIFVDCTADAEVAAVYKQVLDGSISVVAANKKANSQRLEFYEELKKLSRERNAGYFFETNVGAGLPVINTLQDLVVSGDSVLSIEGILSGTLSYLFNSFRPGTSFSEIVRSAREKGYTEPDPRDDLNGMDVARKILILAREAGFRLEPEDVRVQSLIPEVAAGAENADAFLDALPKADTEFDQLLNDAREEGKVLRYIARFDGKKATVGLEKVDADHPFYSLAGSDNIIAFTTRFYNKNPIVIKGPGAGAEVTGAGVISDIMRAAHSLG